MGKNFPGSVFLSDNKTHRQYRVQDTSADMDDIHGTQNRCFLRTAAKTVRYYPLCPVAAESVFLDNFRIRITGVLVKDFRAGIPACPATDTAPAIDGHVHVVIPYP